MFEPAICNGRIIDGTERKKDIIDSDSSDQSYSPGSSIDPSMPAARSPCSPAKAVARGTLGKRNIGQEKPLLSLQINQWKSFNLKKPSPSQEILLDETPRKKAASNVNLHLTSVDSIPEEEEEIITKRGVLLMEKEIKWREKKTIFERGRNCNPNDFSFKAKKPAPLIKLKVLESPDKEKSPLKSPGLTEDVKGDKY